MPFVGSKRCHEACGVRIRDYLELKNGRSRAIAHDFVNIYGKDHQRNWGYVMDCTRSAFGNDKSWRGKEAVTYNHFIISPDPRDGVDVDTLRELTMQWVHEFFGDGMNAGRLGNYEVAVVYHDDNDANIPHAHVVVNNTDLDTGRRMQIDNASNEHALPDRLQEIAESMGLRYFDNDENEKHRKEMRERGRYFTKEERKLIRQGRFCWKQDLANTIQVARRTSRSEGEFLEAIKRLGISVKEAGKDWVFAHPANPTYWKVRGYRLGIAYSRSGILEDIARDAVRMSPRSPIVRENVAGFIGEKELEVYDVMRGFIDRMKLAVVVERGVTVAQAAKTLKVNDDYNIRCAEDYAREIARLNALEKASTDPEVLKGVRAQRKLLVEAQGVAERGSFFANVRDAGPRTTIRGSESRSDRGGNATGKHEGRRREETRTRTQVIAEKRTQGGNARR